MNVFKCDNVLTWYEDGEILEHFKENKRITKKANLKKAIEYAWKNNLCLYIQPEVQDSGLIIDYSMPHH